MSTKLKLVTDALVAAALVGFMTGVFCMALDYVLVNGLARMLEGWAVLPRGWSDGHTRLRELLALGLAAGPAILAGWLMYRSALRSAAAS